jgi:hypothetical protein
MLKETGLRCVGRLAKAPGLYQNPARTDYDKWFSEYLIHHGIRDTFEDFNICFPTFRRELKAVSRYGLPTVEKPPPAEIQENLLEWMEREFGHYVEGYKVLDFEQVDIQGSTTPGIPYKWYYRTKREAIRKCSTDITAFWEYAHIIQAPVLWHNFVKTELLPQEKLEEDNVRSITGPDIAYHFSYCRMVQDFNHRMYEIPLRTSSAMGFNKFYGGLGTLAEKINKHPFKEEADMSKYDARQARWVRHLCMEFRWRMLRQEDRTPENRQRLEYYYKQSIDSYLVTTTGYVLFVDHGMMSGDPNTTVDNTLIHFIVMAYSYMMTVSNDYGHFKSNVETAHYGDDELTSMSEEVVDRFNAEARAPYYEECGVHFKVQETVKSENLEGLTFLGTRLFKTQDGHWVGEPTEPRKTVASVLKPPKKQSPGQTLVRACALLVEAYWNVPVRNIIHGFVKELVANGVEMDLSAYDDDLPTVVSDFVGSVPTLRAIRRLWLGHQ